METPNAPESIAAAEAELSRLMEWGESFTQMQAQVQQVNARASFLQGWLAGQSAKPPPPNRAARRAKGPTKKKAAPPT